MSDKFDSLREWRKTIKVGDVVRIRQWNDMKEEFGLYSGGEDIRCDFVEEMKYLCGKEFTITELKYGFFNNITCAITGARIGSLDEWTINENMVEPIDAKNERSASES